MNFSGSKKIIGIGLAVLAFVLARAEAVNPYTGIMERNMFSLVPVPTNPPAPEAPPEPPVKITPNGIMNVFGQLEVLFKTAVPAQGKEPAHDQSYVMAAGERQDDIEVVKIDEQAGIITFINHGLTQDLSLVETPKVTTAAPSPTGGPNGGGGGPPQRGPGMNNGPGGGLPVPGNALAAARARAAAGSNAEGGGLGGGFANTEQSSKTEVTPEEQIINMEKQRAKWLDEGNPAAMIIPPTKLGQKLIGSDGDSGSQGGPPVP
jgi:hypothetical protein